MNEINQLQTVTTILAIGSVIGPVLFGFAIFKMMSVFVTRQQFEDYKLLAESKREDMAKQADRVEKKIDQLLKN